MIDDVIPILLLVVLGAVAAVDAAAWGQFMFGQPLVAGWLAGVIVRDPLAGLLMGSALGMLWSRTAPVGAAAYPDVGPATVGGVGLLLFGPWSHAAVDRLDGPVRFGFQRIPEGWQLDTPPLALLSGVGLALVAGWGGQRLVVRMRRMNADLGRRADEAARRGDFGGVEEANRRGLFRAFLLGAVQTALLLAAGWFMTTLVEWFVPTASSGPNPGLPLLWWIGLAALGTALWSGLRRDWIWLAGGFALGLLLVGLA